MIASRSPGTSRCGSTLVNHEPGPSTIQSASSTAVTASGQATGSSGTSLMARPAPPVATATWPPARACRAPSPRPGAHRRRCRSGPATSAAPGRAPRAADRRSRGRRRDRPAAASSPITPPAWRDGVAGRGDPSPRNGAGRPRLQSRPHSSSPQSAARAIRRSPGGRQPNSSRSRPARPAVVGDGDDRGEPVGDPAQRGQRRRQAVAAAQRDDPRRRGHSRPRSRWLTCTSTPRSVSRAAELLGDRDAAVLAARAARPRASGSACPPGGSPGR